MQKRILLGFDVEEFDITEEYGHYLRLGTKLEVTYWGLQAINELLDKHNINVTFFTTAFWASYYPEEVQKMAIRNEIASHTYNHNSFNIEDLALSRQKLQEISGQKVLGLRMPRMKNIDMQAVADAGYLYDSSLNPVWVPGRYNNLNKPRKIFIEKNVYELPTSASPVLRIPLFWLSFKNLPFVLYKKLCKQTLNETGYLILYFHPWEFTNLSFFHLPSYIKRIHGQSLLDRINELILFLKALGEFQTHFEFVNQIEKS